MKSKLETFLGCTQDYPAARLVVFGAGYDSTTSHRPGTRFASRAMRLESWGIETYSPYQDKDLADINVFDGGELELAPGSAMPALNEVHSYVSQVLNDNKLPVMLGGEHLLSLGAIKAAARQYPDLQVIHFDAHTDLRDDFLGEKFSHASVMRRVWELLGDGRIFQFGIRSGERAEFSWAKEHTCLRKYDFSGLHEVMQQIGGRPVYFSLDLDVLDPSVLPGTGTPEAGGVNFAQLLEAMLSMRQLNIVGCDIMELNPGYDHSGASTHTACKILRELLLMLTNYS